MEQTQNAIGPITLITGDLRRSAEFYRNTIGLDIAGGNPGHLGKSGNDLVILEEQPMARPAGWSTGLYHLAILVPSRKALARQLKHFMELRVSIQGAADHGVSEAIYLADPDGNGIEVYSDRPREMWARKGDQIQMVTESLDFDGLLKEIEGEKEAWAGMPDGTVMGHIHLRVGDLPMAEKFYREVVGMDVTARYGGGATFMSFDGYHHHLGLNTWESKGAPAAAEGSVGLKSFLINLVGSAELERVKSATAKIGIPIETLADGISMRDPSGNRLILRG
jgi:catechol 2,3-dioxygenase